MPLLFVIPWSAFLLWYCAPLKRVRLSGDFLLVSNYRREIRVPLHSVQKISDLRWLNPPLVLLRFRTSTPFGQHVSFLPKQNPFSFRDMQFWKPTPVVLELRQRVLESGGQLDR